MNIWKYLITMTLLTLFVYSLYIFIQIRSIKVEVLNEGLFVIRGVGGNATVIATSEGTVVVDSMTLPMQGRIIRSKAEELTGTAVVLLINTHYHLDHTHGNPGFEPGTRVISTERTLSHLKALDGDFWEGDASLLLPNETFSNERTFELGDVMLRVIHPGRGHTDGDLVLYIEKYSTVVMGDLFFNRHYPNIDLEAGGSVQEWPATLANVLALDITRVIPGHGATATPEELSQFQRFMTELAEFGRFAAASQTDLESLLKQATLKTSKGYTELAVAGIPLGLDQNFVLTRAWEEATHNFERENSPKRNN